MARSETTIISLEEAGRRFEEWRHNRSGKGRIPAKLCSVAVEVAGKEGLNRLARELHVAWDDLKRRVATSGEVPQQPGSPAFVELVAPQAQSSLCIGMDAVRSFRNALALDPDKAEHYEFFTLAAVVQRAIKPAH